MADFKTQRSQAARWIHDRKDRVDWWRWQVLTKHNKDEETLGFDEKTAFLIFSDLVHDGLLVPVVASDGLDAYTINPGKDEQWGQYNHPVKYWVRHNGGRVVEWVISSIVGGIIGIGITVWWEKIVGQ